MKHIKTLKIILFLISFFFLTLLLYTKLNIYSVNMNEVPYISTYYIKPIVSSTQDVIINFYITDYNHSEYKEENSNEKFTVTVKINNNQKIIKKKVKIGDNSINLGKFAKTGEQRFSIMCTDKYGRNSHELFNFFLVQNDNYINEYEMTNSDLIKYNINNNSNENNAISTTNGLQKLLDDKKSDGYNRLKLLYGTYSVDYSITLFIPTEFTLDLNNSTIKLNGFIGSSSLMISLNNTFNSHVINGTIEGDYYEHDYDNSLNNSEWVNGIAIEGESKYSSYENLIIKNITGYGATNGIANSPDNSLNYFYLAPILIPKFELGDIDRTSGCYTKSSNRTTCDYIDIGNYSNIDYLTISRYLGYQGNPCNTWNLICHFYDLNKNYISSVDSYQYRRIAIPHNSKYIRITILSEDYPTDLSIQLFRIPTHCAFKNIKFENCRAVGLAQGAMKDMLVENCEFVNCGQTLAKCAYDAEDGWDMMQDVTFRMLNFHDNPNNDFLTCGGHNFIVENIISGKIHFGDRTNSYVVKNNQNITSAYFSSNSRQKIGYVRISNNYIKNGITISSTSNNSWSLIIKDCIINGHTESSLNDYFIRCDIGPNLFSSESYVNSLGIGNYISCSIHDKNGAHNYGGNYKNCTLTNINGNFLYSFEFTNCKFKNIELNTIGDEDSYSFNNCYMINFKINFPYGFKGANLIINACTIEDNEYLLKLPHYSLNKNITLTNNYITSNTSEGIIIFYDDRINNSIVNISPITITKNIFNLPNSKYIISGLTENTQNNIYIILNKNTILSNNSLYNSIINSNNNIDIEEKN